MTRGVARRRIEALDYTLQNNFRDYGERDHEAMVMAIEALSAIEDIKAEIAEYKDDKIIHLERNEMVDNALEIIDRHISGKEKRNINGPDKKS